MAGVCCHVRGVSSMAIAQPYPTSRTNAPALLACISSGAPTRTHFLDSAASASASFTCACIATSSPLGTTGTAGLRFCICLTYE